MSDELIAELVADLTPVTPVRSPWTTFGLVLVGGAAWVAVATFATGPMRPGAWAAVGSSLLVAAEALAGVVAVVLALVGATQLATPGARLGLRALALPLAGLGAWVGVLGAEWIAPPQVFSLVGKRPHCSVETVAFGIPVLLGGLWLLRRHSPASPWAVGLALGLGAAAIPAALMQWACMYDPVHALRNHLAPGLWLALLGVWAARRLLVRA